MRHESATTNTHTTAQERRERGSALVLAIFVLVLLAGMGVGLLFLSQNELKMSQANLRIKRSFYLAEAGLEDGRLTLFATNGAGEFDDDLDAAAGADDTLDFDVAALAPTYDGAGNVTGFDGFNDDVPLRPLTTFGTSSSGGTYAAFLTNDPAETDPPGGVIALTDSNNRVMLTSIGAGPNRSVEIVQAIISRREPIELLPPAAITMLGPLPQFDNGSSNAQNHDGNDCKGTGVPGLYVPIVGTVDSNAMAEVQADMSRPDLFESGTFTGTGTVGNLSDPADPVVSGAGLGTIDPSWTNCQSLQALLDDLAFHADYYCDPDYQTCDVPATSPTSLIFIDGDLDVGPTDNYGILVVTGTLTMRGNCSWHGLILAVGEGIVDRNGGGGGEIGGGIVVADIAGPDNIYGTADDCSTAPDGFDQSDYHVSGGGNSEVYYCTTDINSANTPRPYDIEEFLQR